MIFIQSHHLDCVLNDYSVEKGNQIEREINVFHTKENERLLFERNMFVLKRLQMIGFEVSPLASKF